MKVVKVKSLLSFPVPAFMKVYVLKGMRGREKNHYDGRERVELLGLVFLGGVLCWVFMASEQQEWFVVLSSDACTCWVEKNVWFCMVIIRDARHSHMWRGLLRIYISRY